MKQNSPPPSVKCFNFTFLSKFMTKLLLLSMVLMWVQKIAGRAIRKMVLTTQRPLGNSRFLPLKIRQPGVNLNIQKS